MIGVFHLAREWAFFAVIDKKFSVGYEILCN